MKCRVIPGSGKASVVQDSSWGEGVLENLRTQMKWQRIERGTLNVRLLKRIPTMPCPQGATLCIGKHSIPVVIVRHRVTILELMAEEHLRTVYSIEDMAEGTVQI